MSTRTLRRRTHIIPSTPTSSGTSLREGVEKGKNSPTVTLTKLDSILSQLYESRDLPIRSLSGDIKTKYNQAVSYITILHDSTSYPDLSELIARRFGGKVEYTPGTIGSYFGGCYVQDSVLEGVSPGCTPSCLGSIPPGNVGEGYNLCESQVINMSWIGTSYLLTKLNDPENESRDALIYLDDRTEFYGFSRDELQQLKSMNVENVRIISSNSGKYKEVLSNTKLASIPIRSSKVLTDTIKKEENTPKSSNTTLWICISIIVILVILLLLWR